MSPRFLFVVPTAGRFPVFGFLSTKGFRIAFSFHVYFERVFSIDGGYCERVPPASNVLGGGVLAAETKTTASSHQQPTTYVACRVLHLRCFHHTKGKIVTQSGQSIYILCVVHPPSNPHLVHFLFQLGVHVAPSCIALSYLGRQNELTSVGSIS